MHGKLQISPTGKMCFQDHISCQTVEARKHSKHKDIVQYALFLSFLHTVFNYFKDTKALKRNVHPLFAHFIMLMLPDLHFLSYFSKPVSLYQDKSKENLA